MTEELQNKLKYWRSVCSKFVNAYPVHLRLDCENELNSLIWEGYLRTVELNHPNPDAFIDNYVFGRLRNFAFENRSLRISQRSCKRKNLESRRTELVDIATCDSTMLETLEGVSSSALDFTDECLIVLRVLGVDWPDIMSALGLSKAAMYKRLEAIRGRYYAKEDSYL